MHLSFSDLVNEAAQLELDEYEKFIAAVNKIRAKRRRGAPSADEAVLLEAVNRGFPTENWLRMQDLDAKMEEDKLTEREYTELTELTTSYEKFSVERLQLLKKLALLRNVSLEETMTQLGLKNGRS